MLGKSVHGNIWCGTWCDVRNHILSSVSVSHGAWNKNSVWEDVDASVWANVESGIRDNTRTNVMDSVYDSIKEPE